MAVNQQSISLVSGTGGREMEVNQQSISLGSGKALAGLMQCMSNDQTSISARVHKNFKSTKSFTGSLPQLHHEHLS
jgi:hypothetical protein